MFVLFCFPDKRQLPASLRVHAPDCTGAQGETRAAYLERSQPGFTTLFPCAQSILSLPGHRALSSAHGGSPIAPGAVSASAGSLIGHLVTGLPACFSPCFSPPALPQV